MKKEPFIQNHEFKLFKFEIEEIRNLKEDYVYFIGRSMNRLDSYVHKVKGKKED